jgi:hypothetical protein
VRRRRRELEKRLERTSYEGKPGMKDSVMEELATVRELERTFEHNYEQARRIGREPHARGPRDGGALMVTEQVKRMRATLRTCGFTTRDFSVQAERKTEGRRNGQRGYTVFGRAAGITKNRDAAKRAFDARFDLRNAGLTVQVYERDGTPSSIACARV